MFLSFSGKVYFDPAGQTTGRRAHSSLHNREERTMTKNIFSALTAAILLLATSAPGRSQSEKLDRIRVARASDSATEAALWFAKEGGFFEKHGIFAELIRFQGSSLVVSTMLAGEVAISQIGAAAVVDSGLAGGDLIKTRCQTFSYLFITGLTYSTINEKGKCNK